MQIKFEINPVVIATLDMDKFKREFTSSLKIEKAVLDNLVIKESALEDKNEEIKKFIYLNIDWGQILKMFHVRKRKVMEIFVNKIDVENLVQYKPETVLKEAGTFTFEEEEMSGPDFIVTHSFIPLLEHHIERYISTMALDYSNSTWKKL